MKGVRLLKSVFLFCLFFQLSNLSLQAQDCLPDGITFNTQAQLDSFAILYPDCERILGDLTITSTVDSADNLAQLRSVVGSLFILGSNLETLEGLHNITSVGEELKISSCLSLTHLNDLNISGSVNSLIIEWNFNLENINGLESIDTIREKLEIFHNVNLESINGLNNILTVESMLISFNSSLKSISGLNGNIESVEWILVHGNNSIEHIRGFNGIKKITSSLRIESFSLISISGFQSVESIENNFSFSPVQESFKSITGFSSLKELSGNLDLYFCDSLSDLSGLRSLEKVGQDFKLSGLNKLTSLNTFVNLKEIGNDLILFSMFGLEDLSGLQSLKKIGGTLNISSSTSLQSLDGLDDELTINDKIEIKSTYNLKSLSGLRYLDLSSVNEIEIINNTNLSECAIENFCAFSSIPTNKINIYSNSSGCNSRRELLQNCQEKFNNLRPLVFWDQNRNKIFDSSEILLSNIKLNISPINQSIYTTQEAATSIYLPDGNYNIELDVEDYPDWQLTTDSNYYDITVNSNQTDTFLFGLAVRNLYSSNQNTIIQSGNRCNLYSSVEASVINLGTKSNSGILWLSLDNRIDSIYFTTPPDSVIGNSKFGWNYDELNPRQSFIQKLRYKIPGPPIITPGDSLIVYTYSIYSDKNGNYSSDTIYFASEIRCAYDPNDKLVNPNRSASYDENYTLFEEDLTYTIRFQNTGNAEAFDVVILDTLDDNLNVETFQVLATSHPEVLSTSITEGKYISFDFKNIFLPDSTSDFEGSQGYVTYLIEPFNGLAENTSITNSASIYFDQNPPIHTNTTENVMVSELPTSVSVFGVEEVAGFSVFPNPTHDVVRLEAERFGDYWFEVLDLTGRRLTSGVFQQSVAVDLESYTSGIYLLSVHSRDGAWTTKLVKQ